MAKWKIKELKNGNVELINPKNRENIEILFILDRSGSMGSCASDACEGFNAFLKSQKKNPKEILPPYSPPVGGKLEGGEGWRYGGQERRSWSSLGEGTG